MKNINKFMLFVSGTLTIYFIHSWLDKGKSAYSEEELANIIFNFHYEISLLYENVKPTNLESHKRSNQIFLMNEIESALKSNVPKPKYDYLVATKLIKQLTTNTTTKDMEMNLHNYETACNFDYKPINSCKDFSKFHTQASKLTGEKQIPSRKEARYDRQILPVVSFLAESYKKEKSGLGLLASRLVEKHPTYFKYIQINETEALYRITLNLMMNRLPYANRSSQTKSSLGVLIESYISEYPDYSKGFDKKYPMLPKVVTEQIFKRVYR